MAIPTKKEIMDYSPFNSGGKEELPEFRRNLYSELEKAAGNRYAISVTGLRRIGKSTMLKQILSKKGGAYFSFDEQRYQNVESLCAVIEAFLGDGAKTIVLDEIGNVPEWGGTIKKYYDRGGVKFFLSGSCSLKVMQGAESLAGRLFDHYLPPMQFDEYLRMDGKAQGKSLWKMQAHEEELEAFMRRGAFPELHNDTEADAKKYVNGLADKIVYDDIPSRWNVEHRAKLADLAKYCATFSSSMLSVASVSKTLGISRGTIDDYLLYLAKSYLVFVVREEGSYARALQKSKKAFVSCPAIYSALSDSFSEGAMAEVAVFDRLCAWGKEVKFYREGGREVDFIYEGVPIEVKFRRYIKDEDFSGLEHYLKARKKEFGIMVTKDVFDVKKIGKMRVLQVPLSVFLSAGNFGVLLEARE